MDKKEAEDIKNTQLTSNLLFQLGYEVLFFAAPTLWCDTCKIIMRGLIERGHFKDIIGRKIEVESSTVWGDDEKHT